MSTSRSQRSQQSFCQRDLGRLLAAVLLLAGPAILAGCSASIYADHIPTAVGGLPEGVPQRPAKPPAYPAVHDMPPDRASVPLTGNEQEKLEKEPQTARDKQEATYGAASDAAVCMARLFSAVGGRYYAEPFGKGRALAVNPPSRPTPR